eukprot:748819-Hanusia_phi.AAC.3
MPLERTPLTPLGLLTLLEDSVAEVGDGEEDEEDTLVGLRPDQESDEQLGGKGDEDDAAVPDHRDFSLL